MSLVHWNPKKGTELGSPQRVTTSPLDVETSKYDEWSTRIFEVSDLLTERVPGEESLFLLNFRLERMIANSGKTQNPVPPDSFLSLKAEPREMALFTGILHRQIKIKDPLQRHRVSQTSMLEELQYLRGEVEALEEENRILKHTLMELQRPKRVS